MGCGIALVLDLGWTLVGVLWVCGDCGCLGGSEVGLVW